MDRTEFLGQTRLFGGVSARDREAVAKIAIAQEYEKGAVLFWEGDPGIGFFVVVSGRVKVFKESLSGKEQILQIFGASQHFAEVPAFDGECFPASAAALEDSTVLFFSRTALLGLMRENPAIAINMLAVFAGHLRRFARVIEDLSLKDVPQRLAAYLVELSQSSPESLPFVELEISKKELAAFLGTIPETLSRVFAKLSHCGAIEIEGSQIRVLDEDLLRSFAGDTQAPPGGRG
ncbi:Crp/Fnr family transcriptional regulator [Phormidium sp. CCY1219]|uniref:Crp/Fnr family transcriptional regulator n=1 Tax=Phormidium sp. CCY1219 TaxID=2886104 RepID=UPI002D1F5F25|nr:Crp/Fnr family transcriptional regulator [Phormidium sp. CCY1219]MEB3827485.1 Crp/Fnr family transcriptional regulator [Phormidium sp. CCY1219]